MKKYAVLMLVVGIFLTSCAASRINVSSTSLNRGASYAILPFENFTETALAGLRVASIAEGVASSKGYKLLNKTAEFEYKEYNQQEIADLMEKFKNRGAEYVITGAVNEYRYKAGLDGEPAVSITLRVYDLKSGRVVYVGTASKSGWYYQSLGLLAQKTLKDLLP